MSCRKTRTKKTSRAPLRSASSVKGRSAPCPRLRLRAAPRPRCSLRSPSLTAPHCAASARHRAMAHRGRYWPRYREGAKPHHTNGGSMANETITAGPWAGFEVIHRYTRGQAIADGVLVDVTAKARTCGFTVPVAMTATLFTDCEGWAEGSDWGRGRADS